MAPTFFIISTLVGGMINLFTPFTTKEDSNMRNFLLIIISIVFLINVLAIDWLFLHGMRMYLVIMEFGKYSIAFHLEPIGLIFLTLLAVLWICALLYTTKFLSINNIQNSNRFLFFVNCCVLIGCMVALSANLFTMFIGYELLTLCTIPLIAHKINENVKQGLFKYLKILMLSSLVLFLPAVIAIYVKVGHGSFTTGGLIKGHFSNTEAIILLLMFIFGISKTAIYPLHNWLPAAMVASYPVSALLHAVVVVKTGLFCLYKVLLYVFGLEFLQEIFADYNWLILLPVFTIFYSSMQALRYKQIKMILAYSTINQLAIALLSAFLLTSQGLFAAILHMISHSFTKICIFYSAGNIYSVKDSYSVSELIGIRATMPKTSLVMLLAGLSLMGMPPFAGFISKLYIMLAAAEQDNLLVMITIVFSTLFSAIYMIKMLIFIYRPTTDDLILHLKLKPYFDEHPKHKNSKRIISNRHRAEQKLPVFMIISIAMCLTGVIFFLLIKQTIFKFWMLI